MSDLNDVDYFAARAAQALEFAASAADPSIAAIHRRLAASYLELVELTQRQEQPKLRVVRE